MLAAITANCNADPHMRELGLTVLDGGPGHARVRMRVRPEHCNFHGVLHGGIVFSLADSAFGLAANSHGPAALAIDAHIAFAKAGKAGEELTAQAREQTRSRRLATYRVDVTRDDGATVAIFTGTVMILGEAPNGKPAAGR